jgi:osmotically-inducible protein OsmY
MQAYKRLYSNTERYKDTSVGIDTFHSEVLLTGEVPHPEERDEIEQIVKQIKYVQAIHNQIVVTPPLSALTQASDAWITAKIKAKLISIVDVDPTQFKVVTENGTVYLMGIVPPEQAKIAVEVAQETEGVQDVKKFFWYVRISKS